MNLMRLSSDGFKHTINTSEIAVAVVLGNPQYEDCSQHGICRVDRLNEYEFCSCPHQTPAILRIGITGIQSLVFQQNHIGRKTLEKHFEGDLFRIDTRFVFSTEFKKSVRCCGDMLSIEPGFYPLQKSSGRIEIIFDQNVSQ